MKAKVIYLLYRVLQILAWPAVLFYFALRTARSRRYRHSILERAGFLPSQYLQTVPGCIWLHAVSVGEIIASIELIRTLRRDLPHIPVFVSTSTVAGRATGHDKLSNLAAGVFYAPIDYVSVVRRVVKSLQPSIVVILETEIWPNLFREVRRSGAAVVIVNGRISDRTARRYARWRWFFKTVLSQVNRILAQSDTDRRRFIAAGASPEQVEDAGNLKYDFEPAAAPSDSPVRYYLGQHAQQRVWIAASTSADEKIAEEDAVLDAFAKLSGWMLILAPRKPERFDEVAHKISARGMAFVRRTKLVAAADPTPSILLLDSIGELAGLFSLADVVFMGGSLADRGGHNILEPALFAKAIVTGPHLENFREIAADFRQHHAIITIQSGEELAAAVEAAAKDREIGERARARAAAHRGATEYAARVISELHCSALPMSRPNLAARLFLTPLTWVWRRGGEVRAKRALAEYRRIDTPVISVGNITTGGTGKTPFVAWLVERLKRDGHSPGILSRGYGRRSHESIVALPPGAKAAVSQTGDEGQIFLRTGAAALGIAPDRYTIALILRGRFGVDIFVLDDGFQHRRLGRDLDIVLIDALSPFGNGELMPLGRLREPLAALARADVFVITRTELARVTPAIERRLRAHNATAPVFHAVTIADQWVDFATGDDYEMAVPGSERAVAFCGLGNPMSFWETLTSLGITPLDSIEYSDHHIYTSAELRRLVQLAKEQRASLLLTTEKDAINLFEGATLLLDGIKLLWLKIDMAIENEGALLELVAARVA